jgi:SNF2 family DNA or RNA helicase
MYKINNEILLDRIYNPKVYLRGKEYFLNDKIKSVKANSSYDYFQGIVKGSLDYLVKVDFNEKGDIKTTSCQCETFQKYTGDCKHIIALLLFVQKFEERENIKKTRDEEIIKMISYYAQTEEVRKRIINIEYNLEFNPRTRYEVFEGAYLNLKIGEDKMYLVRNPSKLFEHLENGEELEFGKNFILKPGIHRFKEEDKEIMNFLKILYENFSMDGSINESESFSKKRIPLTPTTLKRFFRLIKDKDFNTKISKTDYGHVDIVKEDIGFNMTVSKNGEDLEVRLNSDKEIIPLTPDGEFVFSDNKIHEISESQRKKILPLYNEIILKGKGTMTVSKEHKEPFISQVLTSVKDSVNLKIDKEVEDSIYKPELKVEIYFDKSEDSIVGKVKFIYGEIVINPFSSKEIKINDNKILLRDSKKEGYILSTLEEGDFKVIDGGIYLDDEEEIFNLISNIIPDLQKNSEIYYSESFNNISIRSSSSISGEARVYGDLNMLEFDFNIDGVNPKELDNIFKSIKEKKKFYRLKDGSFLPLENDALENIRQLIDNLDTDIVNGTVRTPQHMIMYLDKYLEDNKLDFISKNSNFQSLVRDINDPEEIEYEIPKEVEGVLRDYQKSGFKWLKTMARYKFGGILADDMGLGKTLQVIAFLLSEKKEKKTSPSLIIVPTSLVFNWEEEINKFAPSLKLLLVHGNKAERTELIRSLEEYDVIVTSYPLIRNDIDLYKEFIFKYCILDEAQHIKNSNSLNAKSVKSLKAGNYFALTGTPMENTVMELWSIFDFLMPGYLLSNKKFIEKYEKPIFKEQNLEKLGDLNKHIRPFILRRLKKDVLKELPEKIEQKILVEMTIEQKKVYLAYIKSLKEELEEEINHKGFNKSHFKILTALTRLRQICCDPRLFIEGYKGGSGKLDSFEELVEDAILGDHRILVFSQFTSMLDIIKTRLEEKDISHMYLSGSTPMEARGEMVKEFNFGYGDVFLISLKAGGSGLNLTGADMVIHFDPWWNPAVEDQATDRAYRIGQENTVQVIKLITKGTIEEKIFKLQGRKKEMIDMIIQEGETLISKLSEEEILELFEV